MRQDIERWESRVVGPAKNAIIPVVEITIKRQKVAFNRTRSENVDSGLVDGVTIVRKNGSHRK